MAITNSRITNSSAHFHELPTLTDLCVFLMLLKIISDLVQDLVE